MPTIDFCLGSSMKYIVYDWRYALKFNLLESVCFMADDLTEFKAFIKEDFSKWMDFRVLEKTLDRNDLEQLKFYEFDKHPSMGILNKYAFFVKG